MQTVVIDANVLAAYIHEVMTDTVHPERTAEATPLFYSLGKVTLAFVDEGGQIEQEWKQVATLAQEWFDAWLAEAFISGRIYPIDPSKDAQLSDRYRKLGLPKGRDIWYIKVAHRLTHLCTKSRPILIAEDVDFYDPSKKKHANKKELFTSGKGPVADQLKADGVDLRCLCTFQVPTNAPAAKAA